MPDVTPKRDIQIDGRNYQGGVGYSVAEDLVQRILDAEAEEEAPAEVVAEPERPNTHSLKAEWVAYAVSHGMTEAEAEDMTKDELMERFG